MKCKDLTGKEIIINENLTCKGEIFCDYLYAKHISSFKKLNAKSMVMAGTLFLNISAESEILDDENK